MTKLVFRCVFVHIMCVCMHVYVCVCVCMRNKSGSGGKRMLTAIFMHNDIRKYTGSPRYPSDIIYSLYA